MNIQYQCIAYKVPLHEIENARNGVPMEQLDRLTEPQTFVPPNSVYDYRWGDAITPKSKKKAQHKPL